LKNCNTQGGGHYWPIYTDRDLLLESALGHHDCLGENIQSCIL
jgi:hypothetical protein